MRENSEVVIIYTDKYANTATVYPPMVTHGNNWILGLFPAGHFLEITTAGNESNLRKIILRYLIMSCPMENHPFRKMILPYVLQKKLEIASLPLLSCGWETQFVVPNRSSFLDTHAHSSEALRDSLLHCILM